MADHTRNALSAAVRALDEVIVPAVDPTHPLAEEQARLVSKYLSLLVDRVEHAHDRNRFELTHYVRLARALMADAERISAAVARVLAQDVERGEQLLATPSARTPDLQAAAQHTAGAISALVRSAAGSAPDLRDAVEREILIATAALLDAQRAWFLPQGWEPDPSVVPPLLRALGLDG